MKMHHPWHRFLLGAAAVSWLSFSAMAASTPTTNAAPAAPAAEPRAFDGPDFGGPEGPPPFGPGGPPFGGPMGPGGFGGPGGPGGGRGPGMGGVQEDRKLVAQFDQDGDQRLNQAERKAAFEFLQKEQAEGGGRRGRFGPGGPRFGPGAGREEEPAAPGPKVSPESVKKFPSAPLYDSHVLRTFFLEFEDADWEKQMAAFKGTDVLVAAKLTVDGREYRDVGVHFRGMSSFMGVSEGRKRSLDLSLDWVHKDQQLGSYRSLELLNSHEDPSFLRAVLSYQVERDYLPAPKANFVRVVINGESWGVYVNAQPFNKDFVRDWYGTTKGVRWKVPGSPGGQGSLAYLGEDVAAYRRIYDLRSKDEPKAWADLIRLCKVLHNTPPEKLEEALAPILDVDEALKFLALENVLINNDGYWIRSSDYCLYQDVKGRFHVLPRDSNETFARAMGPMGGRPGGPGGGFRGPRGQGRGAGLPAGPGSAGGPEGGGFGPPPGAGAVQPGDPARSPAGPDGGPGFGPPGAGFPGGPGMGGRPMMGGPGGGGNVNLDPLVSANDTSKPLLSKLLAVPALRERYLRHAHDIASKWLDWQKLGPIAQAYHDLILEDVKADTRKLDPTEAFLKSLTQDTQGSGRPGPGGGGSIGLKNFADQRRAFLLNHAEVKKAVTAPAAH